MNAPLSLADLAGIDMGAVEAVRFSNLPVGGYTFEVTQAELSERAGTKPDDPETVPVITYQVKVLEVFGLQGLAEGDSEASYIGKTHSETFWIRDIDGLGRAKAFMEDSAMPDLTGNVSDMLGKFVTHRFKANIKHRKNPQDKSNPYANIQFVKVGAAGVAAADKAA